MLVDRNFKYYKFINGETGNVIYFLSISKDGANGVEILESTRQKLACDNGIYVGNIYYSISTESDFDE